MTLTPPQVAIALEGGDVICFELDQMGQLIETEKKEVRECGCRCARCDC